jgi:very-short-patch-repair endonuclease
MTVLVEKARQLRRDSTDAERHLWQKLKGRRLSGYKFVRQAPIGPYIVDFCCREKRLVIELDGGQHSDQARADARRTKQLEALGDRVVRFWNDQVMTNTDAILLEILTMLNHPSPHPSPREARGEGVGEGVRGQGARC